MSLRLLGTIALAAGLLIAGCGGDGGAANEQAGRTLFGHGGLDNTRVVARVDGEPITERMVDLRLEELGEQEKGRYAGPDGRRLLVRKMVDEVLAVRDAERNNLQFDPQVARVLNAQYRMAMLQAHDNQLVSDVETSVDDVREFFEQNRERYVKLGTMNASHIECATRARAEEAYAQLQRGRAFETVAVEFTENEATGTNGGSLGWFNRGGFIPGIKDAKAFTEAIWDLQVGVNPPVEFAGKWHVVKVHQRRPDQLQTLDEAYARVEAELLPVLHRDRLSDWRRQARQDAEVQYFGEFRPGHGKTPKELLERAFYAKDPQEKAEILRLLIEDYPDDELTDDALFMAGNLYFDTWGDRREASFFFGALVRKFPDSDYASDAQYILDNMGKPGFSRPQSIEDLRQD